MDEPSSPEGTPITLRIKFKSVSLDDFVARYGADVSAGGIFIRTEAATGRWVGAAFRFQPGRRQSPDDGLGHGGVDSRTGAVARRQHSRHGGAFRSAGAREPADSPADLGYQGPARGSPDRGASPKSCCCAGGAIRGPAGNASAVGGRPGASQARCPAAFRTRIVRHVR